MHGSISTEDEDSDQGRRCLASLSLRHCLPRVTLISTRGVFYRSTHYFMCACARHYCVYVYLVIICMHTPGFHPMRDGGWGGGGGNFSSKAPSPPTHPPPPPKKREGTEEKDIKIEIERERERERGCIILYMFASYTCNTFAPQIKHRVQNPRRVTKPSQSLVRKRRYVPCLL